MKQKKIKQQTTFKIHNFQQPFKTLNHNFRSEYPPTELEEAVDSKDKTKDQKILIQIDLCKKKIIADKKIHPFIKKYFPQTVGKVRDKRDRQDYQARAFQRLLTGIQLNRPSNIRGRFLTLTSSNESFRSIKKSFDILKNRIERATWKKDGFHGFKFNKYYNVRTSEGEPYQQNQELGVYHIIYYGGYIPVQWLP